MEPGDNDPDPDNADRNNANNDGPNQDFPIFILPDIGRYAAAVNDYNRRVLVRNIGDGIAVPLDLAFLLMPPQYLVGIPPNLAAFNYPAAPFPAMRQPTPPVLQPPAAEPQHYIPVPVFELLDPQNLPRQPSPPSPLPRCFHPIYRQQDSRCGLPFTRYQRHGIVEHPAHTPEPESEVDDENDPNVPGPSVRHVSPVSVRQSAPRRFHNRSSPENNRANPISRRAQPVRRSSRLAKKDDNDTEGSSSKKN